MELELQSSFGDRGINKFPSTSLPVYGLFNDTSVCDGVRRQGCVGPRYCPATAVREAIKHSKVMVLVDG